MPTTPRSSVFLHVETIIRFYFLPGLFLECSAMLLARTWMRVLPMMLDTLRSPFKNKAKYKLIITWANALKTLLDAQGPIGIFKEFGEDAKIVIDSCYATFAEVQKRKDFWAEFELIQVHLGVEVLQDLLPPGTWPARQGRTRRGQPRTTHGFMSTKLVWVGDDLGVARGGRRGMAWLPAQSMDRVAVGAGSLGRGRCLRPWGGEVEKVFRKL